MTGGYLFSAINAPPRLTAEDEAHLMERFRKVCGGDYLCCSWPCKPSVRDDPARIVDLARAAGQALPRGASPSDSAVAIISPTCASTARTRSSKCGVFGLIHRPYAWAAFSRLTGMPAMKRVRTALLAIAAAATVSTKWRSSSSFIGRLPFGKQAGCDESGTEDKP